MSSPFGRATVGFDLLGRSFNITLLVLQAFWMLVVLPGHVRGMIVMGGDSSPGGAAAKHVPSCCAGEEKPYKPGDTPSPERQQRCAVCYQAHGYTLPTYFDFHLGLGGLCELRRLIEPSKLHRLLCRPTYFANGPPDVLA